MKLMPKHKYLWEPWRKWRTYGEDGIANGISSDAPEWAKKEYEKFMEKEEEYKKRGIKF